MTEAARRTERCPVCQRKLVRLVEHGEIQALAHENPPCDEYAKLGPEEFIEKYMLN